MDNLDIYKITKITAITKFPQESESGRIL